MEERGDFPFDVCEEDTFGFLSKSELPGFGKCCGPPWQGCEPSRSPACGAHTRPPGSGGSCKSDRAAEGGLGKGCFCWDGAARAGGAAGMRSEALYGIEGNTKYSRPTSGCSLLRPPPARRHLCPQKFAEVNAADFRGKTLSHSRDLFPISSGFIVFSPRPLNTHLQDFRDLLPVPSDFYFPNP